MNINIKNAMNAYFRGVTDLYEDPNYYKTKIEEAKDALRVQNAGHQAALENGTLKRGTEEHEASLRTAREIRESINALETRLTTSERIYSFHKAAEPLTEALKEAQGRATARTLTAADICKVLTEVQDKCPTKKALDGTVVYYDGGEHFPSAYRYTPESTHFIAEFRKGSWRIVDLSRGICPNRQTRGKIVFSDTAKEAMLKELSKI